MTPATSRYDYITDGAKIYERSFATIRAEADLSGYDADEERVAVRMIHAAGEIDLTRDIAFSPARSPRAWRRCGPARRSSRTCRWSPPGSPASVCPPTTR